MKRRGYTLIEIIITIAITAILSIGMFKAFEAITVRSEKAKLLSTLSMDSQSALDQIGALLYNRAPYFTKGCDINGNCEGLEETNYTKKILTWYGLASEGYLKGDYSGFIDMNASNSTTHTLRSPNTDLTALILTEKDKWNDSTFSLDDLVLVFSGSFDAGEDEYNYTISGSVGEDITLGNYRSPMKIYEKYVIADSAYAVARKEDILSCPKTDTFDANTLLLFYDFRPWRGEKFCDGQVAVLATDVNAFKAISLNGTIRLSLDLNHSVRGSSTPVHISKQKVVF